MPAAPAPAAASAGGARKPVCLLIEAGRRGRQERREGAGLSFAYRASHLPHRRHRPASSTLHSTSSSAAIVVDASARGTEYCLFCGHPSANLCTIRHGDRVTSEPAGHIAWIVPPQTALEGPRSNKVSDELAFLGTRSERCSDDAVYDSASPTVVASPVSSRGHGGDASPGRAAREHGTPGMRAP